MRRASEGRASPQAWHAAPVALRTPPGQPFPQQAHVMGWSSGTAPQVCRGVGSPCCYHTRRCPTATLGSLGRTDPGTCHIGLCCSPISRLQGKPGLLSQRSSTPTSLLCWAGVGLHQPPKCSAPPRGRGATLGLWLGGLGWDPATSWQVPRGSSPGTLISTCTCDLKVPSGACPARQWV